MNPLKKKIIIDDRRCQCLRCEKQHECKFYAKFSKYKDMIENSDEEGNIAKIIIYLKKCNNFEPEKKEE